ncbi:carboxymuconolactone decarboxylase family protein [Jannaschia seohaensis]|uniref:AhpD family alkylhydroperoxidase n=1 Tax=Jannaschia seohaensis TaxID=475081 RepID=A0A2Y9B8H7_9RHOB|nr:carboxymuconolactone decarboxylase family protein [Jannaschia seohaensis]PWJ10041.1 AhpD family alkylhydroperoxidase [Jannaschia seohaensis]SSA51788.1 alkylhydroperoxidase AhpD family core domain-containing protein [Jannaschia seohaensis]
MIRSTLAAGLIAACAALPAAAQQDPETARQEIEETLGAVPSYLQVYPEAALGAGWAFMKGINLNQQFELDPKTRELILLAVSAQIPCDYCVYYHRRAAAAFGASEQELREAVLMAAVIRHWSTILHGAQYDMEAFRAETDGFFPE